MAPALLFASSTLHIPGSAGLSGPGGRSARTQPGPAAESLCALGLPQNEKPCGLFGKWTEVALTGYSQVKSYKLLLKSKKPS